MTTTPETTDPNFLHRVALAETGQGYTKTRPRIEGPHGRPVRGWRLACLWCDWTTTDRHLEEAVARYRNHETAILAVEAWNDTPVGTMVRYWTGLRTGPGRLARTRTAASLLGGHTPVVWVHDEPSAIALTHIDPLPDTSAPGTPDWARENLLQALEKAVAYWRSNRGPDAMGPVAGMARIVTDAFTTR